MNVKSKTNGEHNTLELVIEVDAKTFDEAIDRVYNKQRKSINIPGFRKGKAPRKIVEAMFGANVFYEDAVKEAYPKAYEEALEQEGIEPAAYPQIEVLEAGKEGFSFKAVIALKPEVKLGQYKGLTAPKAKVEVTQADIDNELKPYIQRATRLVAVKRKARRGDTAVIDFEGFDNGVPFEGGKGEGYSLELGSNSFVPGFEDGVVGMKAGEEKEIDITFPEDYTPELAGKPVVFKVKVQEVKEHQAPELDDEFAKDVSEFDTLAEFRKDLGDKLQARRESQAQDEFQRQITDQLIENLEADVSDMIIDQQADKLVEDYAMRITNQGIPFEQYLAMTGMSVQALREDAKTSARRRVLNELALEAVAKAEGITVTDEERQAELQKLAENYGMEPEQVKAAVPEKDLDQDILMRKASEFVFEHAKAGKAPGKKSAAKDGEDAGAKKPAAKKTAKKEPAAEGEKPAAKKPAKRTSKKAEE